MLVVTSEGTDVALKLLDSIAKAIGEDALVDEAATIILSRVRKRFMQEQNPDGSSWIESMAAKKRKAGIPVYAKGGPYAPGGMKTGGKTLFASGNLFHSIQMIKPGTGIREIRADADYAIYVHGWVGRLIMGTNPEDISLVERAIVKRIEKGGY